MEDYILIYRIVFNPETHFPSKKECICIDQNLHVQLQYGGNLIPLPQWFIYGHNFKLTRFSKLENFPNCIQNVLKEHPYSVLKELQKRQHYEERGSPVFPAELIRYALLLRYMSKQAYKLLLENFSLTFFSLLKKTQRSGTGSITAVKLFLEKGHLSQDCVLMVDEMYFQKEYNSLWGVNLVQMKRNFIKD